MKQSQCAKNPFPNTDSNKRYYTYNYYLRNTFGGKCVKIPMDIGCTCPNIDGTRGYGGCIYCSGRGSGDFAPPPTLSIRRQYEIGCERLKSKWEIVRAIPYFQAHTNTYAPAAFLREKFTEALSLPGVVGINIATRADCLNAEALSLLSELAEKTTLTVELGLQSANDETARRINRCHTYAEFCAGYAALRAASSKLQICVHLINGLPGENESNMLETASAAANLHPDQIKFHLLHVLRGTILAEMYTRGEYSPMTQERYIRVLAQQLALLPPDIVIGRVTGDGAPETLLAPLWSRKKFGVLNALDQYLYAQNLWQGKNAGGSCP